MTRIAEGKDKVLCINEKLLSMGWTYSLYPVVYEAVRQSQFYSQFSDETLVAWKQETWKRLISQAMRTSLFLGVYRCDTVGSEVGGTA